MKNIFVFITLCLFTTHAFPPDVEYVKGKGYQGFIFPKEHSIWGFPPNQNRYTPDIVDITKAETILRDSITTNYIKSNQLAYSKPPINKKTLRRYFRQYVGYSTEEGQIIIHVFFSNNRALKLNKSELSEDIVSICDGGVDYWSIKINLSNNTLFDIQVNGIS